MPLDLEGEGTRRPHAVRWHLVLLAALLACSPTGEPGPGPPDILLVTIDTLRADRIEGAAPFLAEFARGGIRFDRAYATASWTLPSMASLVTGTYPARHGVERSAGLRDEIFAQEVLPEDLELLPERLSKAGYATYGVTANQSLAPPYGFARGFDRYECLGFEDDGARVLAVLDGWLGEIREHRPWFVWLHLLDPHAPYAPREPFLSQRWDGPRFPGLEALKPAPAYGLLRQPWTPERLGYVRALYAAEVASIDALLRGAFERLGAERALTMVTSDHGEEFREHGGFGHGRSLYEETLRVPLFVRLPDGARAGEVVKAPVSLVDVMPTLLEAAGLDVPEQVQGRSLLDPLDPERPVFVRLQRDIDASAVIRGDWKLIETRRPAGPARLYDLASDPAERAEADAPQRAADLHALLETHERESAARRTTENPIYPLSPEQAAALRELGYVDQGPAPTPPREDGS